MASNLRWPTVPPKCPHFFKIILPHTLSSGKLMIPKMFVSKYGKTLSDSVVYLKVPSGQVWQIDVTRKDGEVWLHGRWTRFAMHYSVSVGYLLVFRHQGSSTFSVFIFDMSASEIQYPACRAPKTQPCNEDDDFVPIPRRHCVQDVKERGFVSKANRRSQSKILATITPAEKARALERSASFESDNPYFKIVMQPSYAYSYLPIPMEFAEKHLTGSQGNVSLRTSDGRAWSVPCSHVVKNNKKQVRLYCGWKSFAKDNALEVGDVCVFELKDPRKISLQVVIFRHMNDTASVADRTKMKEPKMEASETDVDVRTQSPVAQEKSNLDLSSFSFLYMKGSYQL